MCVLPLKHPLWKRLGISAKKGLTSHRDKCWKGQGWGQCKVKLLALGMSDTAKITNQFPKVQKPNLFKGDSYKKARGLRL